MYLIKQGVRYGCYVINKQEFPRHQENFEQHLIFITDITECQDLQAADEYEPIFDNAVLMNLYSILNEREQLVIKEHYIFGYSYKAIAERHNDLFANMRSAQVTASRTIKKMQEYAKAHKITA